MAIAAIDVRRGSTGMSRRALDVFGMRFPVVAAVRAAVVLLVIGNLGRLPIFTVGVKDIPLLLSDLLALLVCAAVLLAAVRSRSFRIDSVAAATAVFAAIGLGSAVLAVPRFGLSPGELVISTGFLFRWLAYFGFYLALLNCATGSAVSDVWRALERAILVFASFGIFQSFFLPDFAQIVYPDQGWDVQGRRLVSTFLDPNFAGGFIAIGLLVLLARLAYDVPVPRWKLLLLFAALTLTLSRSAFVGFFVGAAVVMSVRGHSRRILRFWGMLALLVIPFVPLVLEFANAFGRFSMSGSAMTRIVLWSRAITILLDNLLIGIGFNTYVFVQENYGWSVEVAADSATDGGLLFIAVMTGLVGVSVYVAILAIVLRRCRRVWRNASRSPEDRGLALGIGAATIAILVHSVFLNSLLYAFIVQTLWILWGLAFLLHRENDGGPDPRKDVAQTVAGGSRPPTAAPVPMA